LAININETKGGIVFTVKVVPGSSRTAIAGVLGGKLRVKVAAPPEKGKANKALIDFLAGKLGVKRGTVQIITGRSSAVKTVEVAGFTPERVREKLM